MLFLFFGLCVLCIVFLYFFYSNGLEILFVNEDGGKSQFCVCRRGDFPDHPCATCPPSGFLSRLGSRATCQLLSERTLPPGSCGVVFKAWETGPRRGRPGPARPRHLVSATCGQESTQPSPGASASRGSAPVALPGGTPGLMGAAGALP